MHQVLWKVDWTATDIETTFQLGTGRLWQQDAVTHKANTRISGRPRKYWYEAVKKESE